MSRSDPPIWVRAVTAVLLLFASWWLLETEVLRKLVGDSVAMIALGIVAFPVLRGMHLDVGVWPEGPWRDRFKTGAMVWTAVGIAVLLLVSRFGMTDSLAALIDIGDFALVVTGAIFWGTGTGMVRQRPYLGWYALAALLAMVPILFGVAAQMWLSEGGLVERLCLWQTEQEGGANGSTSCVTAAAPPFLFLVAVSLPSALITEELAFRRLLIGCARQTGLIWVLAASVVAAGWYWLLVESGLAGYPAMLLGGVGAVSAGCLYVLSRSLMVSAVFSGFLLAGTGALQIGRQTSGATASQVQMVPLSVWVPMVMIAAGLSIVVAKRNGVVGQVCAR